MKRFIFIITLGIFTSHFYGCFSGAERPSGKTSNSSIYEYTINRIDGVEISLSQFKGKKLLLVNVASKCGFTSQYEELEKLHQQFKDGLVIIGFPANNFMGQEPGTNEDIAQFCSTNFGVTFLMAEKISVKGDDIHPIYKWLSDESLNGWNTLEPKWNFYKYLVDETGELIKVFPSNVNPLNENIVSWLK